MNCRMFFSVSPMCPGESEFCIHMAGDGHDVVFLGAGELVLGGDHLDVVGCAGLKTVL